MDVNSDFKLTILNCDSNAKGILSKISEKLDNSENSYIIQNNLCVQGCYDPADYDSIMSFAYELSNEVCQNFKIIGEIDYNGNEFQYFNIESKDGCLQGDLSDTYAKFYYWDIEEDDETLELLNLSDEELKRFEEEEVICYPIYEDLDKRKVFFIDKYLI